MKTYNVTFHDNNRDVLDAYSLEANSPCHAAELGLEETDIHLANEIEYARVTTYSGFVFTFAVSFR